MGWLPVLFVCLNTGSCFFIYDDAEPTEKACQKIIAETAEQLVKEELLADWKGSCIPVKPKMI
jgi:hypothetical protein